jgi:hypothetical protein
MNPVINGPFDERLARPEQPSLYRAMIGWYTLRRAFWSAI